LLSLQGIAWYSQRIVANETDGNLDAKATGNWDMVPTFGRVTDNGAWTQWFGHIISGSTIMDGKMIRHGDPGDPDPAAPDYTRRVLNAAWPLLQASQGRAFLLFTSYRALREAEAELARRDFPFPLLVQGSAPRDELLRRFRDLGNAVLLGTGSFWEGVDVRGPALSLVVIDKLPFASPGDPLLQARLAAVRASGGEPFMELQLPQAVIALKQGVGRLIRDIDDRGVLMLCDPRLITKPYGRTILASLPPMRRTREASDVEAFFARMPA
jgi:ATP-dependent DNA helicase DinG